MAIIRPTLAEVRETMLSDADTLLGGIDARLERSLVQVVLNAQAGALHGAYGYLQQLADDLFPDTAQAAALERWAGIFGISRGAATFSQGWVGATGTLTATIPLDTILRRADGREYIRTNIGVLSDGSGLFVGDGHVSYFTLGLGVTGWAVPVVAVESGAAGNVAPSGSLSFVSPIEGVPPIVTAVLGLSGAVDSEPDAALQRRVLARLQNPPQGGTAAEYQAWTLGASTPSDPITHAFVRSPASGSNVVTVYVINTGGAIPAAHPPTPSATAITNATAAIDARKPLSADRNVLAPTLVAQAFSIHLSPSNATIQAAVTNELDAWLVDNHEPGQEVPLSILQEVVSRAAGGGEAKITVPAANLTPGPAEYRYLGAITWV